MVAGGLGWDWFLVRVLGLSTWSKWGWWRNHRPTPPLEGEAAQAAFDAI